MLAGKFEEASNRQSLMEDDSQGGDVVLPELQWADEKRVKVPKKPEFIWIQESDN